MDEMSRANRTTADFKTIWGDGEFWSCLGYEGIPVVFGILPEAFHSLEELDKRGLMRLLGELAEGTDQSLRERVCDSEGLSPADRLPNSNHWLELALEGTRSNRDAIGARIRVVSGGQVQFNHVTTVSGYASSSAGPVHFGLGAARIADEVEIRWPSGILQKLKNLQCDRIVHVKEAD